jgi:aryl-alcohol dehydrogenase-like predicted oxidoreductase
MGIMPWSPLAGGFLTGKYDRDTVNSGGRLSGANPFGNSKFTDRNWDILATLRTVADEQGCTPAQAALAWAMDRPGVTSTLIGARTVAQLQGNLAAADIRLTDDQTNRLDQVSAPPPGFSASLTSPMIRRMVFGGNDVAAWAE